MAGNERFEDSIGTWLEGAAPTALPERVLAATFERTRRTRQATVWRTVLGRGPMPRSIPALGGAAVAVAAAALLALNIGLISLPGSSPTPPPAATPLPSVAASSPPGFMWPQSNLEEVRQAQQLADAGDARYTWQLFVDGGQVGQHHPCGGAGNGCLSQARDVGGSGEIFVRFLEEELGWEEYFWDEELSHRGVEGLDPGDVVFVRCAAGLANPLYPTDPEQPGCAPTIDELRYERVKVNVAQPDRQGPTGIWVVTGWEMIEPATQVAPLSLAEVAAFLEPFFQARIVGEGAEGFVDLDENDPFADERVDQEIPLLYATSTGASYERSEFEVVDGPVWPTGETQLEVRLFAAQGETVVEQLFSLERDDAGRLRLVYDLQSVTTENGNAVPVTYGFLDGVVTYRAAHPLGPSQDAVRARDRLTIDGLLPDDDTTRRIAFFIADPRPLGLGCEAAAPTDAEALARILRSVPNSKATAPIAVTIGGLSGLQMDGVIAHATTPCVLLQPSGGPRARLYLVDLPGGPARVLAIATSADEDSFETVLSWAMPVIDSIEFHAP